MCRLRRLGVVLLVACLCVGAVPATPTQATHQSGGLTPSQLGDSGIEPDGVLLRADLRADGDARWTVEYRVRLNDENTTAAFESLRDDIAANETAYTETFADRMRSTVSAAENATGREMAVRDVSVQASRQQLPQEYGVVTYQFEWTGFAATAEDGTRLEAGDALAGLFLDRQTTLVIAWPGEYAPTSVQPSPDERRDDAVAWLGPTDFGEGQPAVAVSTAATETGGGGDGDGDGQAGDGSSSLLPVVAGLLVVAVGVAAAFAWRRSRGGTGGDAVSPADSGDGGDGGGSPDDAATEGESTGGEAEAGAETDTGGDAAAGAAPWDDELLSNEERVLLLLEHNDGRMKQQAIASELDWSDAKTSQVVGKLREEDDVETFRIGRENVVSLPDTGMS